MRTKTIIGENINKPMLWGSLLLIWGGSVLSSRFDDLRIIFAGAGVAALGCYLNLRSVKWVTDVKSKNESVRIEVEE